MAFGKIKADAIIRDNNGTEEEVTMASLVAKAGLASPTFTGTVTLPATTALAGQASDVTIIDDNAAALEVKEGSTAYVTFDTTNDAEQIEVAKNVELAGNLTFTASADVKIKDNAATAFQIKEGTTDYITFDTTNSGEQIEVAKPVVTTSNITLNATNELRLADSDSSHHIAIKAPDTVTSNVTLKLPADDGDANEFLQTNGSGVLSWAEAGGGKLAAVAQVQINAKSSHTSNSSHTRYADCDAAYTTTVSNSKLLVHFNYALRNSGSTQDLSWVLKRKIGSGSASEILAQPSPESSTVSGIFPNFRSDFASEGVRVTWSVLDSPGHTAGDVVTYELHFKTQGSVNLNSPAQQNGFTTTAASYIQFLEIEP